MFKTITRWYILLVLSLTPLMASAAGEVTLDSIINAAHNGTDKSLAAIGYIFGLGGGVTFSGGGRFEQVFFVINGIALVLGLVYFTFAAVSGIAQTAHDGEFLGKRYSSIWLPIRFMIGVMSMVPVVGGWGIAQIAMLWMSTIGVGSANLITEAMIAKNSVFDQNTPKVTLPSPSMRFVALQMLEANICMESINKGIQDARAGLIEIAPDEEIHPYIKDNQIRFVNEGGFFGIGSRTCGKIEFGVEDRENWSTKLQNTVTLNTNASHGDPLYGAKVSGLNQMQSILNASAKKFIAGEQLDEAAIAAAGDAYQKSLLDGMTNYKPSEDTAAQRKKADDILRSGGWIMLGAMYQSYATFSSSIRESLSRIPVVSGVDPADRFDMSYNQVWESTQARFALASERIGEDYIMKAQRGAYAEPWSGMWIIEAIKNQANARGGNSDTYPDPLIGLKNVGDTILIAVQSLWLGKEALSFLPAGKVVGGVSKVISAASKIGGDSDGGGIASMLSTLLYILFFTGIVLSLWLPMIPFVTWISACLSWAVIVFEAIISAPLWAMAHLEAEGEGMGQRTTHGYMFAINLLLRPMLLVFGFLGAWLILTAMAGLTNTMFMIALENAQIDEAGGTSITGLISIVGFVIIYGIIMMILVNKSFDLIHTIPESITEWLGGHIKGDHGRGGEKDMHGMVMAAVHKSQVMPQPKTPSGNHKDKNNPSKTD